MKLTALRVENVPRWLYGPASVWNAAVSLAEAALANVHHHSQELREGPRDIARFYFNRRGWLRFGEYQEQQRRVTWQLVGKRRELDFGWSVTVGGEDQDVSGSIGFVFGRLYFGIERRAHRPHSCRSTWGWDVGVDFDEGTALLQWWLGVDRWADGRETWRKGFVPVVERLFGYPDRRVVHEVVHHDVPVPMPEGSYPAIVTMQAVEWSRPRLPLFKRYSTYAEVRMVQPIPEPGKGENAWDCGDDATFSLSTPAISVEDAVGKMVASVMRDRKKRQGHYGWNKGPELTSAPVPAVQ